jgi:hypothetical protein
MIKYPNMREELIEHLESLAKSEVTGIDFAFHFFLDDTPLGDDPAEAVGLFLANEQELTLVLPVVTALRRVLARLGPCADDAMYVRAAEWSKVVQSATQALRALEQIDSIDPS